MANPDRARGLRPVYHINGGSWNNALAVPCLIDDAAEEADGFFIGSPVFLANEANSAEGNLATYALVIHGDDENDEYGTDAMYGVVVGIGRPGETGDLANQWGMFNPTNLGNDGLHVSMAEVETDPDGFVLYVAPARGWVFEGQVEAAADSLTIGEGYNLNNINTEAATELGNVETGQSSVELVAVAADVQFICVGFPDRVDNDTELANADIHVVSAIAFGSQDGVIAAGGADTE